MKITIFRVLATYAYTVIIMDAMFTFFPMIQCRLVHLQCYQKHFADLFWWQINITDLFLSQDEFRFVYIAEEN